jgi:uncharacterized protein YbjT (DUF2867 family)
MSGSPVAVLGASGLIGQKIARHLIDEGFAVMPVARHFTQAQKTVLGERIAECPIVTMEESTLQMLLATSMVVVNCLGVLQDDTDLVHRQFLERLLRVLPEDCLLVHLSIPGDAADDRTAYSRSKRAGETLIADAGKPYAILRPGFVLAPAAFGGSAVVRALAALPVGLARREAGVPFATIGVDDLAATVTWLVRRRRAGIRQFSHNWDVMERAQHSMGAVVAQFRRRFGGPEPWFVAPSWLLDVAAFGGDLAARLGWRPPVCGTAVAELRRGVTGNPDPWIAATNIEPAPLETVLARLPATVQEGWFARLFLLKPLIIAVLVLFWVASGTIALTVAFTPAMALITAHGVPRGLAHAFTIISSLLDIGVGLLIARRATCKTGLIAGIVVALGYMAGCALLMPELWAEPLGALVKTGPAIVLMLVALAILDVRR